MLTTRSTTYVNVIYFFLDDDPVLPDELQTGKQYIVSYGSRQYTGRGNQERHITVLRKGDTSECEYYKGYNPQPGVWVTY